MSLKTPKRTMFFGDSITWGWVPTIKGALVERYPPDQRWTGLVAKALGDGYEVIEEGLNGRTTDFDDPTDARLNGANHLPSALASHLPLDLVVIMLGTNDTKAFLENSALQIAVGMAKLLGQVAQSAGGVSTIYPAPKPLLLAPPLVRAMPGQWFDLVFEGAAEKTAKLACHYKALAEYAQIDFINTGDHITADGIDGIHLSVENNAKLAEVVTEKIRTII